MVQQEVIVVAAIWFGVLGLDRMVTATVVCRGELEKKTETIRRLQIRVRIHSPGVTRPKISPW